MTTSLLDTQLDLIEQQLNELRAVLLDGNFQQVYVASGALQQLAVGILQITNEVGRSSVQGGSRMQRIQMLSHALQPLREGLLRQSAYVDRALEIVMPAAQHVTYASDTQYGGAMRQSGVFKVLSA